MFPTPHTVQWQQRVKTTDALGNDKWTHLPAVPLKAYSYTDARQRNAAQGTPNRVEWDVDLSMPTADVKVQDKIMLPDSSTVYLVTGVRRMNGGWHGWQPGIVAELKVTSG